MNVFQVGVWQHIAATYDKASGMARIYVDGLEKVAQSLGTFTLDTASGFDPIDNVPTGYAIHIGHLNYFEPRWGWVGMLDEVSLYDRALTATELLAIASAGAHGKYGIPQATSRHV